MKRGSPTCPKQSHVLLDTYQHQSFLLTSEETEAWSAEVGGLAHRFQSSEGNSETVEQRLRKRFMQSRGHQANPGSKAQSQRRAVQHPLPHVRGQERNKTDDSRPNARVVAGRCELLNEWPQQAFPSKRTQWRIPGMLVNVKYLKNPEFLGSNLSLFKKYYKTKAHHMVPKWQWEHVFISAQGTFLQAVENLRSGVHRSADGLPE